ncbi:MAG: PQQ-binding-like beta-propeller repeat protein [Kiritimatiellae bacterium]|nr:PQQ-binding-like beta-propeller repeat protein [Kiritimatiellia bacterium]
MSVEYRSRTRSVVSQIFIPLRLLILVTVVATLSSNLSAQPGIHVEGLPAHKEAGWTQWRGPKRDSISDEKGLLQSWPQGGPKQLWVREGLGIGYSSPIISGSSIYITADIKEQLIIFCLDLNGKLKWKASNGRSWQRSYPGARASCILDRGRLYNMNGHGRVTCLNAKDGSEKWSVSIIERFDARPITWGYSECMLIDGDNLIVTPCGKKASMAALSLDTGKTLWTAAPIPGDTASYSSPLLFTHGGIRYIITCSSDHVFSVNADTGKLLWSISRPSKYRAVSCTPTYIGKGRVFISSAYNRLGELYQVDVADGKVAAKSLWLCDMNNLTGGTIYLNGLLYGSGYRSRKGLHIIDAGTGKTRFHTRKYDTGPMTYADGRFYCLSERGIMRLLEPTAAGLKSQGSFRLVRHEQKVRDAWAHPVIWNGRLYLRYHDRLYCYKII